MNTASRLILLTAALGLAACDVSNKTVDGGFDSDDLSTMEAGIWIDPEGCHHWMIDDGLEGYLSQRMGPDGRPVCTPIAPPNTATGPFKKNQGIADVL